jgi:hypothetical protein
MAYSRLKFDSKINSCHFFNQRPSVSAKDVMTSFLKPFPNQCGLGSGSAFDKAQDHLPCFVFSIVTKQFCDMVNNFVYFSIVTKQFF